MLKNLKIADYVTLLNLVCGINSIFFAASGQFKIAIILILCAAIFDMLDGFIARKLKQQNDMGIQLDSLSDIVSFGVAPAFLSYQLMEHNVLNLAILTIFVLAGVIRLAYYNTKTAGKNFFIGMPITTNSVIIPLAFIFATDYLAYFVLACAILMILPFKIKKK